MNCLYLMYQNHKNVSHLKSHSMYRERSERQSRLLAKFLFCSDDMSAWYETDRCARVQLTQNEYTAFDQLHL